MDKGHIIVSGCSISSDCTTMDEDDKKYRSYPKYLQDDGFQVTNLSESGLDNGSISRLVIHEVYHNLMESSADDIFVIIQWSGVDRMSSFVTKSETIDFDDLWRFNYSGKNDEGWAVNRGKSNKADFWKDYFGLLYTEEGFFINTLEHILRTQWFLESVGVKYKMFAGWDIFTFNTGIDGGYGKNHPNGGQFLEDKNYSNKDNTLLKDTFKNSTHLWDLINFDNFWFFENENVKFGGMVQWVENRFEFKKTGFRGGSPFDFHPNDEAHKVFWDEVIISNF
jgi:hypothetical protein